MRYAVYLTPAEGAPLAAAAEAWLGRSAFDGRTRPPAAPPAANPAVPARYGFHATLKAPFRLAAGRDEAALVAAFHALYGAAQPALASLTVSALPGFVALTAREAAALSALAETAVRAFEPFRAPPTPAERQARRPERLDARGRTLFETWGYPHVMERFFFHMTLSGPVEGASGPVVAAARTHFAALLGRPQRLVHALFREAEAGGPFHVLASQPLPDHAP